MESRQQKDQGGKKNDRKKDVRDTKRILKVFGIVLQDDEKM